MQLQPKRPPGRRDRKAAAFAHEVVRLRAGGYTYDAIREALAEVGIHLSESALRREVRRQQRPVARAVTVSCSPTVEAARPAPSPPMPPSTQTTPHTPPPTLPRVATGRELAEAFFNAHPCNPLLPNKDSP